MTGLLDATDTTPESSRATGAPLRTLAAFGPAASSAAVAVQLTLLLVLAVDPPRRAGEQLTEYGEFLYRPELDVLLYVGSTICGLVAAGAFAWLLNRRARAVPLKRQPGLLLRSLVLHIVVAAGTTTAATTLFFSARQFPTAGRPVPFGTLLALAGCLAAVVAAAALAGAGPGGEGAAGRMELLLGRYTGVRPASLSFSALDVLVPVGIAAVFYIPIWRQLAGRFFLAESLFHWDYYAMSPTLGYFYGNTLGTDISSMYGVGWPIVFSALFNLTPPSYGRMIQVGSIYACIYLVGVYLLFRLLVRRPLIAAAGTALVSLQLLIGMDGVNIWQFPSLTPMRFALDIWCFLAVAMHLRTGKRLWVLAAGVATGLAVAFSTDTGLYLGAACGTYWLASAWRDRSAAQGLRNLLLFGAGTAAALLPMLLLAGRGQVLDARFWTGWLESVLEFGGGFAQLPLATVPNRITIVSFVLLFFAYAAVAGFTVAALLGQRAGRFELFNGLLGVYGLMFLLHFLGRSGDYSPYRLWIPLALIATLLTGRTIDHLAAGRQESGPRDGRTIRRTMVSLGASVVLAATVALATPASFLIEPLRNYPGLAITAIRGRQPDGLCLLVEPRDICGLPEEMEQMATEFRQIAGQLEGILDQGDSFAVLEESGSIFYLAAGAAPWSRYPRPFVSLHNQDKLDEEVRKLRTDPPDYVLTRMASSIDDPYLERYPPTMFGLGPHPHSPFTDTWQALLETVRDDYRLQRAIPPFELWSRN